VHHHLDALERDVEQQVASITSRPLFTRVAELQ